MSEKRAIRVVSAVIEDDGKFLITQRRKEAVLALLWEFPGGRVNDGESDEDALKRALRERLAAEIDVGEQLSQVVHEYDSYTVTLVIFSATLTRPALEKARVNDFKWVKSVEFGNYEFPPADQVTMDQLLGFSN